MAFADATKDSGKTPGYKADAGKPRMDLIPPGPLFFVAQVAGCPSSPRRGWAAFYNEAQEHLLAWWGGQDYDLQTGLPTLAHATFWLLYLASHNFGDSPPISDPYPYPPENISPNRFDLLPVQGLIGAARVFTYGAEKYSIVEEAYGNNWLQGMRWGRCYAALQRHLLAPLSGEQFDSESRLPHTWHALCCAFMLLEYATNPIYAEHDDRPTAERIEGYRPAYLEALERRKQQQLAARGGTPEQSFSPIAQGG